MSTLLISLIKPSSSTVNKDGDGTGWESQSRVLHWYVSSNLPHQQRMRMEMEPVGNQNQECSTNLSHQTFIINSEQRWRWNRLGVKNMSALLICFIKPSSSLEPASSSWYPRIESIHHPNREGQCSHQRIANRYTRSAQVLGFRFLDNETALSIALELIPIRLSYRWSMSFLVLGKVREVRLSRLFWAFSTFHHLLLLPPPQEDEGKVW